MYDIETVDRAFSTREAAEKYVLYELRNVPYFKRYPERLDAAVEADIKECLFDDWIH